VLDATNSDLQKQIDIPLSHFGSWNSLILVIIYEYLRRDISPWYRYFKVLPTTFNTLMFWNPAELAELQGSAVLDKIGRAEVEEDFKTTIIPFMKTHAVLFPVNDDDADSIFVQLAHMAGSLIMAYAFDLGKNDDTEEEADEDGFVEDDEEDPAKGMVPFADMLNADADRNNVSGTHILDRACIDDSQARLFHEEELLIMKATRPILAGDEIFNYYGPLPRSALLRMYGYITDNYAQYDVAELSSQTVYDVAEGIRKKYKRPRISVRLSLRYQAKTITNESRYRNWKSSMMLKKATLSIDLPSAWSCTVPFLLNSNYCCRPLLLIPKLPSLPETSSIWASGALPLH
jgi:N-lysine methyltransferase SETD6